MMFCPLHRTASPARVISIWLGSSILHFPAIVCQRFALKKFNLFGVYASGISVAVVQMPPSSHNVLQWSPSHGIRFCFCSWDLEIIVTVSLLAGFHRIGLSGLYERSLLFFLLLSFWQLSTCRHCRVPVTLCTHKVLLFSHFIVWNCCLWFFLRVTNVHYCNAEFVPILISVLFW